MNPVLRSFFVVPRPALVAAMGFLPLGMMTAFAQTQPRPPGEVPYLNFPPVVIPAPPSAAPAAPPDPPLDIRPPAASPPPAAAQAPTELDRLRQREQELTALRSEQRRTLENEAKLKREIDTIGDDRRKLNSQLIEAAARVRGVEDEIAKTEERLKPLDERELALRKSLEDRRAIVGEVLAAMQRIGRNPPPALMVRPEDALQSLRSAMLLGAVLPEMRQETEALLADLAELVRIRKDIAGEKARFDRDLLSLGEENLRLAILLDQRQNQQAEVENSLTAERQRTAQLARQADNLKDLIGKVEQGLDGATRAARARDEKKALDSRPDLVALKDPGRLAPAVAFASARKLLPLPVNGVRIREFGGSDGLGGTEKGLSIASRPGAQVTAPCDGWVVYAGPFRNYGQLLILNAGGGYHVLLAGVERISVDLGQFVVTGEPVAVMGGRSQAAAAIAAGSGQPVLYVEFRKDGTPVDPGPWWAASEGEKVRG
ncbi:MAG: murein hydrolase activator [Alphaproteobacteria bacterium]|nr:murein hydrolase activator [Alphaproteobacteria bacterium]